MVLMPAPFLLSGLLGDNTVMVQGTILPVVALRGCGRSLVSSLPCRAAVAILSSSSSGWPTTTTTASSMSMSMSMSTSTPHGTRSTTGARRTPNITVSTRRFMTSSDRDAVTTDGSGATAAGASPATIASAETSMAASLFKNPIVHQLWTARQQAKEQLNKASALSSSSSSSSSPSCQLSKTPSESFVQVSYNFSSDGLLREAYRNPWGRIRFGKLLEDLDALAGNIAFFHVNSSSGSSTSSTTDASTSSSSYPVIVTASVDRIQVQHEDRPMANIDQCLSGQVTWTGTSSMEIRMQCADAVHGIWLEAYVTFVTLDAVTKKPVRIPAIRPTNEAERVAYSAGAARAVIKKNRRLEHRQFLETVVQEPATALLQQATPLLTMPTLADGSAVLLKDTAMQNAMIAQPQVQNLHNRIFGGFLMRRAFELAYANAYMFGGTRPRFREVDEVSFTAPVDIGDLLVFNSRILYYVDYTIHVEVEAWVTVPETVTAKRSNQFYFTFAIQEMPKRTKVLPSNMDEARQIVVRMMRDKEQEQEDRGMR